MTTDNPPVDGLFDAVDTNSATDPIRILVVDDEKVIREILADFLSLEGFDVGTACDGREAVARLAEGRFHMVISDLKMPNMDGLALLEHVRRNHEDVLAVIMTGFGTVETAIEAMKKGAYDYILKPFKVEEVVHVVQRGIEQLRLKSENLRLKEVVALHALSSQLQSTLSLPEVIASTLDTMEANLGADGVCMALWGDGGRGVEENWRTGGMGGAAASMQVDFDAVHEALRVHNYVVAHNEEAVAYFETAPAGLRSFAAVPLVARKQYLGVLCAVSWTEGIYFTGRQKKLLEILGSRAAAAVDNAALHAGLKRSFNQTIQALARALEAMDRYTAGHSDRVTLYASLTAEELGLPEAEREVVAQAAMLHDIGKMGCHTNLNKAGRLTDEEYEIFKQHPVLGKEILDPIDFLRPVIPGVLYHHERWDGQGYPEGLSAEGIPVAARILSVADAYDAMTSDRAYRKALSHAAAVSEIRAHRGTQFDPAVADAFLRALDKHRAACIAKGEWVPD